jgi:two-component system response regulator BaeR
VGNEVLDLTPSEFNLLKVLMTHPDRVFTRSELMDKVQGYQFEGYDRTIDTHIKNLRKKISEKLTDREIIRTVYGVGYKLSLG